MFRCVNGHYDQGGEVPYESVEDFLAMCESCNGERPVLRPIGAEGMWYDVDGSLTLVDVDMVGEALVAAIDTWAETPDETSEQDKAAREVRRTLAVLPRTMRREALTEALAPHDGAVDLAAAMSFFGA